MAKRKSRKKRHADYLLRRVRAVLRDERWRVCFALLGYDRKYVRQNGIPGGTVGLCDRDVGRLLFHPYHFSLRLLIHECLHVSYPTWLEREVNEGERLVSTSLSPRQATNLMALFARRFLK